MLPPWVDNLAVLLWPWRVKNGIILPPVKHEPGKHRHGNRGDEDKQDHDHDAGRARRDERHEERR